MFRLFPAMMALFALTGSVTAQDRVTFRDRSSKGSQTVAGKIESESLAGLRVAARMIPIADVIDVQYDVPGVIKLDYPRAVAAESRSAAEAVGLYEALLRVSAVQSNPAVKRHIEYRIAALTASRADENPEQRKKAIEALTKFRTDHHDAWQLLPLTRTLARLYLDREPPDFEAARKTYEDLAAATGAPPEIKEECAFQSIDLLLAAGNTEAAKKKAAALPASDPRTEVYRVGCEGGPDAARKLEAMIDKTSDRGLKAAAYNMLGDVYRRDPKTKKDAIYAYLWVDVIYNDDPGAVSKADGRLAVLFAELKDDERARRYREKARGK
jgi:hypothetical protein